MRLVCSGKGLPFCRINTFALRSRTNTFTICNRINTSALYSRTSTFTFYSRISTSALSIRTSTYALYSRIRIRIVHSRITTLNRYIYTVYSRTSECSCTIQPNQTATIHPRRSVHIPRRGLMVLPSGGGHFGLQIDVYACV